MKNEKRLIDANALEQHCKNTKIIELFPEWKDFPYAMKIALLRYGKAWKEIIQNAPTVDAVEVVHGRWERLCEGGYLKVRCTACGVDAIKVSANHFDILTVKWAYCPNCGAKMDGDGNA